ncbi:class I SAM-dependent methyltransferase [Aminobacter sp. SR38]|uniref:class I SAM-dependent methyltransferase n=1 Tax=Aminobacter sp. SR38 TaxID=2774562 RepID=UPI00177AF2E4|nr:class I SAM-dependent methyltransferase [Aminobacter sp. SR38]QOF71483.1 class I SAM-dependent methyltransferase [Aminobacter sp. SR38]
MLHDNRVGGRDKGRYWNEFYAGRPGGKIDPPSQFAAFVLQEAPDLSLMIEVGSGGGRDSFFFARHGVTVAAIDGSISAVQACERSRADSGLANVTFHCASVGTSQFHEVISALRSATDGPVMVYARFFLHALTDDEEDDFFSGLAEALEIGDLVAFEYRTVRDASGAKVTPDHYRRFVDPAQVFVKAGSHGFVVDYAVEGYGLAKFKQDDAYVARCILRKI